MLPSQRVRDGQSGIQAFFLTRGEFGLSRATLLALFDKRSEGRVAACSVRGQWMLRRDRTERDTHDGVSTRGEHKHFAVLD